MTDGRPDTKVRVHSEGGFWNTTVFINDVACDNVVSVVWAVRDGIATATIEFDFVDLDGVVRSNLTVVDTSDQTPTTIVMDGHQVVPDLKRSDEDS